MSANHGRPIARHQDGKTYFMHPNQLGSTTMVTDQTGATIQKTIYYPWGQAWASSALVRDNRFAGMDPRDAETANDPTLFRMYQPRLYRWLSPDPLAGDILNPQSLNRYAYVMNNPVNLTDPLGLEFTIRITSWAPFDWSSFIYWVWSNVRRPYIPNSSSMSVAHEFGPGGNGYAGGGGAGGADTATNKQAKNLLNGYFATFAKSNCAKVFGKGIPGFSVSAFESKALSTNYYDPYQAPYSNYTQNQVTGNGNSTRLWNTFTTANRYYTGVVALTINGGRDQQSAVLLGPDFFAESATQQTYDLVHEAIHAFSGMNDTKIFERFGPKGCVPINQNSTEGISAWIARDCK